MSLFWQDQFGLIFLAQFVSAFFIFASVFKPNVKALQRLQLR